MPISANDRSKILRNSREPVDRMPYTNPFTTGNALLDSSLADVQNAFVFGRRVGALLSDIATEIAEAGAAKITAGQELVPGKEVDQFLWARDYQAGDSELAMKKIIDHFGETVADAAAMYARTDVEIRAALVEFVVPALAAAVANKRR